MEARRATPADAPAVAQLTTLLASPSPLHLEVRLELDLLSVLCAAPGGECAGFLAVADRVPSGSVGTLLAGVQAVVEDAVVSAGNALVLTHFALRDGADAAACSTALLRGLFALAADLDHVLVLGAPGSAATDGSEAALPTALRRAFVRAPAVEAEGEAAVFLCSRQHFVPTLYVRPARVEDHDDLAPIFEAQSEVVSGRFGEFFLAEAIDKQSPRNRVLVGEGSDGRAVGLLSATADVPTQLLQACFQTAPFGHLVVRSALLRAHDARAAVLSARELSDWFSVLGQHGDELQGVFEAIPARSGGAAAPSASAKEANANGGAGGADSDGGEGDIDGDGGIELIGEGAGERELDDFEGSALLSELSSGAEDAVAVNDIATVFDHKGDAWGFVGVGGAKLGRSMLVDLGVVAAAEDPEKSTAVVTRSGLNAAVAAFAQRRDGVHRRMRTAAWYAAVPQAAAAAAAAESDVAVEAAAPAAAAPAGSGVAATPAPAAAAPGAAAAGAAVVAPASVPVPTASGSPVGRKMLVEECDRLCVQLDAERKERLRNMQQAVASAQKDIEAATSAERAAEEAARKEAYDRDVSGEEPLAPGDSAHELEAHAARARKAEAEARLEAKSAQVIAAQSTITQTICVPLTSFAAAVTRRVTAAAAAALASSASGSPASAVSLSSSTALSTGDEAVAELAPFFAEAARAARAASSAAKAAADAAAAIAGVPAKAVTVDMSDARAVTKAVFSAGLEAWEKHALPAAVAPAVIVSTSFARARAYTIPLRAGDTELPPAAATAAEEGVAQACARLLGLPYVHLPQLLGSLAAGFAAAEDAVARAIEKIRADDELKKKKEEEAAKKALAAGPAKKKEKKKEEPPRVLPSNSLVDPAADAFGALLQHMQREATSYARGLVLTGAPLHDAPACDALAATLEAAGTPAVLNLHVEEGRAAAVSPAAAAAAAAAAAPPGMVARSARPSTLASERMLAAARRRRDSCSPRSGGFEEAIGAPLSALAASGRLGTVVRVEGRRSRLVQLGLVAARAAGGSSAHSLDRENLSALLPEPLTATLLREGLLRADPTAATPGSLAAAPLDAAAAEREALGGAPNAIAVTLFCLAQPHESRFVDLLAGAFEAFPDREYAVVTQPFAAPDIPLLRRFVQVSPTPSSTLSQTLYVCHRDALVAPALASVRRASVPDRAAVRALVVGLPGAVEFMDAVVAAERRAHMPLAADAAAAGRQLARIACFVAEVDGQCIAALVLSATGADAAAVEAAALSFAVDEHLAPSAYLVPVSGIRAAASAAEASAAATGVASLCFVAVNPIFLPAVPFVLRQAARLFGGRSALFYRQPASALGPHVATPLPPAVREHLVLLRPRHLPELSPAERMRATSARAVAAAAAAAAGHFVPGDGVSYAAHSIADLSPVELADPRALDHALYVFSARLSAVPRVTINSRLLIVGASDAALAAVAALVLNDGTRRLPHLTLLAPGGLPAPRDYFASPAPFTAGREFTGFELARLPVSAHVRIVDDSLARISRKERSVQLSASRTLLRYDRMLLLPGLTEATWARLGFESPDRLPRGMHCISHAEALGALTADVEALAAGGGGGSGEDGDDRQVIVLGDTIEALTAISGLLDRGVRGAQILHLRPPRAGVAEGGEGEETKTHGAPAAEATSARSLAHFAGEDGEALLEALLPPPPAPRSEAALYAARAVATILEQAGVREIAGADVLGVRGEMPAGDVPLNSDGSLLISLPGLELEVRRPVRAVGVVASSSDEEGGSASMESRGLSFGAESKEDPDGEGGPPPPPPPSHEVVTLRAALLVCAGERDVEPRFFKAVNDCGVVYDGRLVVDHRFVATDPAIFGGGSVAKFSRRYRAPLAMQAYDSREVGAAVAASVLRDLSAGAGTGAAGGSPAVSAGALLALVPRFTRPKAARALLPGGLHFVSARLPEFEFGPAGREIATHVDARADGSGLRHARVLLSRFGSIAELSYIGTDAVEASNLIMSVGHSASYMNGLVRRAEKNDLPDLVAFLRSAWAGALFHDRFLQLVTSLRLIVGADAHVGQLVAQTRLLVEEGGTAEEGGAAEGDEGGSAEDRVAGALLALHKSGVGVGGSAMPEESRRAVEHRVVSFLRDNRILTTYLLQ